MKKVGLVVLAVAALALVFAPLATGMLTQARFEERIAAMDDNPTLAAAITSYDRGWFTSRAEVEVRINSAYLERLRDLLDVDFPPFAVAVPVVVDVYHGPVSFAEGGHIGMTRIVARTDPESPLATFATTELGMPYLFEFRGEAGLGNRFDFEADVPPIDYAGAVGDVAFSGFALTGTGTAGELRFEGTTDGASYQNPFAAASVGSIRFAAAYEFVPGEVPLSDGSLEIERIVASSPMLGATPLFEANGVSLSGKLTRDEADDRLTIAGRYAAASIAAGEDFKIDDAEIVLTLADIDGAAARDYYVIMQEMRAADPPANQAALLDTLTPVLDRIAAAGPSLILDPLRFSMPEGRFEAAVTATLDTSGLPPGQAVDLRNIAVLFGAVSIAADATVAKPLARRLAVAAMQAQLAASDESAAPGQNEGMAEARAGFVLVGLVGQGLLEDAGDSYSTSIEFRDGALTVNGAPMPLFGLL